MMPGEILQGKQTSVLLHVFRYGSGNAPFIEFPRPMLRNEGQRPGKVGLAQDIAHAERAAFLQKNAGEFREALKTAVLHVVRVGIDAGPAGQRRAHGAAVLRIGNGVVEQFGP